jgi:uncharacterized membrane protein YuzA (DUF378 family)
MAEVSHLNVVVCSQNMKAVKTFQLILVGPYVGCAEIATCGYLLIGISFKQGGVKWTSFVPKKILKKCATM